MTSIETRHQRKVTITEIEDWELPDTGDLDNLFEDEVFEDEVVDKTTEEIFDILDDVIQDWKVKLEYVVANGLKKIKKSTKESKVMMKYLPGDGTKRTQLLREAKVDILNIWEEEITNIISSTHKNLDKLGNEKIKEAAATTKGLFFPNGISFPNNTVENSTKVNRMIAAKGCAWMGHAKQSPKKYTESFANFKHAIEQLHNYLQSTSANQPQHMFLPVYKPAKDVLALAPAKLTGWNRWHSILNMMINISEVPVNTNMMPTTEEDILDILKDFTVDQDSFRKTLDQWNKINEVKAVRKVNKSKIELKQPRRGSNAVYRMKERKERKENARKFRLCEFKNKQGKHYLVVKSKRSSDAVTKEAEDIFEDWKDNLGENIKQQKIRVRKISHRAQRKEIIREAEEDLKKQQNFGPLTYSEALKKNLNLKDELPLVEEIFENWAEYMTEMTRMLETSEKQAEQVEDIFKTWKYNLGEKKVKPNITLEETDDIMADWHHNLSVPLAVLDVKHVATSKKCVNNNTNAFQDWTSKLISESQEQSGRGESVSHINQTMPEEYFAGWRHNFGLKSQGNHIKKEQTDMESIFHDWLFNLQEPLTQRLIQNTKPVMKQDSKRDVNTMKRRLSEKQRRTKEYCEDDKGIESPKDTRRDDFLKDKKIENKKRTQANRRSGKREI